MKWTPTEKTSAPSRGTGYEGRIRLAGGKSEYLACDEQKQRRFLREDKATDREARGLALPVSDLPHTDIRFSFLADQRSRSLRNLGPFMDSRKSAGRAEVSERVFHGVSVHLDTAQVSIGKITPVTPLLGFSRKLTSISNATNQSGEKTFSPASPERSLLPLSPKRTEVRLKSLLYHPLSRFRLHCGDTFTIRRHDTNVAERLERELADV
jgi:hypothetical protein